MNTTTDIPLYIIIPTHCQLDIDKEEERCSRWKSCSSKSWSYSRTCQHVSGEDRKGSSSGDISPPFPSLEPPRAPRRIASDADLNDSSSSSGDDSHDSESYTEAAEDESILSPHQVQQCNTNPSLILRSFDSLSCEARLDLKPNLPRRSFTMHLDDDDDEEISVLGATAALTGLLRGTSSSADDESSDDDDTFFDHDSLVPMHCLDDSLPPRKPARRHSEPNHQLEGMIKTVMAAVTA